MLPATARSPVDRVGVDHCDDSYFLQRAAQEDRVGVSELKTRLN